MSGKGGAFERKIAKMIVKAFVEHHIKQRECWRSVNSGGHEISAGDLYMSNRLMKLFPFAVECKNYRKILWVNFLLKKKKCKEMRWIEQAKEGAKKIPKLHPLLVMKSFREPIYAMDPNTFRMISFSRFLWKWARGKRLWVKQKEKGMRG